MALLSLDQEVLGVLFFMIISNLIEFFLMKGYGIRARLLSILFIDHIYVIFLWAFGVNYTLFYLYFSRIARLVDVSADLVLNVLLLMTEAGFVLVPFLFPEIREIEESIFQRSEGKNNGRTHTTS